MIALIRRYDFFLSSLSRKPYLNTWVRNLTIRCRDGGGNKRQQKDIANVRANALLQRLPNIQSLCMDWHAMNTSFLPNFEGWPEHSHLREVRLPGRKTSLETICRFMSIASLSSIVVGDMDPASKISSRYSKQNSAECDRPDLDLLELGNTHLQQADLTRILRLASTITTLQCTPIGIEEPSWSFPNKPLRTKMKSALSPASMTQALLPLQACLVELILVDRMVVQWPGHDGTRLDLNGFSSLRRLKATSNCFFRGSLGHRGGIRDLLPPSLKELNVRTSNE